MNLEYAKQLFKQCKDTHSKCSSKYDIRYCFSGLEMMGPSEFDDEFNVPAILLFQELCSSNAKIGGHYDNFRLNLLKAIHNDEVFDVEQLTQLPPPKQCKKYKVLFEVFFQKENNKVSLPFKRQILVRGLKYKWCSQRTIKSMFNLHQARQENIFGMPLFTLEQQRSLYFPKLNNNGMTCIHPVITTVDAENAYAALDMALSNFEIVKDAINIVQAIGMQKVTYSGKRPASITAVTTGIFLAYNSLDINDLIFYSPKTNIYELPRQKLSFTNNQSRMDLFHEIIKALCDNVPVSRRIKSVVGELSLAYATDIPGLRQLSCWRCLELATAKSGNNRKEKEIIQIFQNYYPNKFWKQMGSLVMKVRNTYVHQGKLIDSGGFSRDYYLNWSQQYAEKSLLILLYLYNNRSTWKTEQQIDKFFDYYAESDDSLKVAQQLLSARLKHKP